ncbi:hypothetical protein GCM10011505_05690 [Tistrella bauzanensis]|uniref:Uncharacterized protein n=1 Tax=Tistrella bauzanensis TaxID=657419 RepID=A0ABQ1I8H7_9PROT|nr:hypothetical protein GCM10011505_05690 [Tistrella bauzanensis]
MIGLDQRPEWHVVPARDGIERVAALNHDLPRAGRQRDRGRIAPEFDRGGLIATGTAGKDKKRRHKGEAA